MAQSLAAMVGLALESERDRIGHVSDIFFDDRLWTVRYLVIKTAGVLRGRHVLLSASRVWIASGRLHTDLSADQVNSGPDPGTDPPVSAIHEQDLHTYYRWPFYWGNSSLFGEGRAPTTAVVSETLEEDEQRVKRSFHEEPSTNVRSLKEVIGYRVEARDGRVGKLRDLVADDGGWKIGELIVQPYGSAPVLRVPPVWVDRFIWREKSCFLTVTRDRVNRGTGE